MVHFSIDNFSTFLSYFLFAGAFLVNYDKKNWHMLTDNFRFLPSDIQLQLLVDSLILSNVGLLDYSIFLNMSAKMIIDEQHLPLWIKYSTLVSDVMERFDGTLAEKYKVYQNIEINIVSVLHKIQILQNFLLESTSKFLVLV